MATVPETRWAPVSRGSRRKIRGDGILTGRPNNGQERQGRVGEKGGGIVMTG